jgi:fumarate hydratase class I
MVDPTHRARKNTRDNTPAIVHTELVPGDTVEVQLAAKGGGSENKSKFAILNPSDSIVDWVLKTVPDHGRRLVPAGHARHRHRRHRREGHAVLAKESLMDPIDIHELKARGPNGAIEELRLEIFEKVNALGIGAQGLGGLTTVLDVKIKDYPTHAASLPVAMIPNCAATRHIALRLDGSGPALLTPPSSPTGRTSPGRSATAGAARQPRHGLTREEVAGWQPGEHAAALRQAAHRPRRRAQEDPGPARAARACPRAST